VITRRSWERPSVVLGQYHDAALIGGARALTDFARFAYLSDVYVEPANRGHGLGAWLVQTMLDHPEIGNVRWLLHIDGAHGLYCEFRFVPTDEKVMERLQSVHKLKYPVEGLTMNGHPGRDCPQATLVK
jgi:GNAT superfamily N-acetyltransferase